MVRAGEAGGVLDSVLQRLADHDREAGRAAPQGEVGDDLPGRRRRCLVLLIVTAMLLFVIPMFQSIYRQLGGTLPVPTQILINISNVVRKFWCVVFARGSRRACSASGSWINSEEGRKRWDTIKLKMPVFGGLATQDRAGPVLAARCRRWCARVCRSSSRSTSCARPPATGSSSEAVRDTQQQVKRGEPLSQRLEEHPVFPPMVVQMMAVGEETGALDEMLDKIADFYDQEVEATVNALTSLIEPLLIVVMGVVRRRHDHRALPADVQRHQAHQVTGRDLGARERSDRRERDAGDRHARSNRLGTKGTEFTLCV